MLIQLLQLTSSMSPVPRICIRFQPLAPQFLNLTQQHKCPNTFNQVQKENRREEVEYSAFVSGMRRTFFKRIARTASLSDVEEGDEVVEEEERRLRPESLTFPSPAVEVAAAEQRRRKRAEREDLGAMAEIVEEEEAKRMRCLNNGWEHTAP